MAADCLLSALEPIPGLVTVCNSVGSSHVCDSYRLEYCESLSDDEFSKSMELLPGRLFFDSSGTPSQMLGERGSW